MGIITWSKNQALAVGQYLVSYKREWIFDLKENARNIEDITTAYSNEKQPLPDQFSKMISEHNKLMESYSEIAPKIGTVISYLYSYAGVNEPPEYTIPTPTEAARVAMAYQIPIALLMTIFAAVGVSFAVYELMKMKVEDTKQLQIRIEAAKNGIIIPETKTGIPWGSLLLIGAGALAIMFFDSQKKR